MSNNILGFQFAKSKTVFFKKESSLAMYIIPFLYSIFLSILIPVDGTILDRANYLEYVNSSEIILLRNLNSGYLSVLTNEPIWLLINIVLNHFFQDEISVRLIIFFASFTSSYLILKEKSKSTFLILLILIFPSVIIKYVVHLRQGLAISFFLIGWFSNIKIKRYLFFFLTPFIHSSFFIVLFLFAVSRFLKSLKLSTEIVLVSVIFLGLFSTFGINYFSNLLGARQANEYDFSYIAVSGLGFIFWFIILIIYLLQGGNFNKSNYLILACIVFYLTTYFLLDITSRVFESVIIIVLIAGKDLTSWRKIIFILAVFIFIVLSWVLNINKPWLGWAIT